MCKHGTVVHMPIGGRVQNIDQCISHLVAALNAGGIRTEASCCGHGYRPGRISLQDGREIYLATDQKMSQEIDNLFPLDIHGEASYTDLPAWDAPGWDSISAQTKNR